MGGVCSGQQAVQPRPASVAGEDGAAAGDAAGGNNGAAAARSASPPQKPEHRSASPPQPLGSVPSTAAGSPRLNGVDKKGLQSPNSLRLNSSSMRDLQAGSSTSGNSPKPAPAVLAAFGQVENLSMSAPAPSARGQPSDDPNASSVLRGSSMRDLTGAASPTEQRVLKTLSSKRLALQRKRRLPIRPDVIPESSKQDEPPTPGRASPMLPATKELVVASLKTNFLFSSLSNEQYAEVMGTMRCMQIPANEVVVEQDTTGDLFYVVEAGTLAIIVNKERVGQLGPGENFGELALLYNCPRAATIMSLEPTTLWCLHRYSFRQTVVHAAESAHQANRAWLARVTLLRGLSSEALDRLTEALTQISFKTGERIITQGEPGDVFYLVKSGMVKCTQTSTDGSAPETEVELMRLSEGEHFGERALITTEPRAASVTAVLDTVCMALDREAFEDLLGPLEEALRTAHARRERLGEEAWSRSQSKLDLSNGEPLRELRTDCNAATLKTMTVLGEGAFGLVQLVQHRTTNEVFALKQMQKARIQATNQQFNVINEKRVLHSSNHPFILKLVNAWKDENCLFMVLEFLQGGDMFGWLYRQGGRFNATTARFYGSSVISVLEYLHAKNVVYRDLKPENLVLDARGFLKVVDFGFAKIVRSRTYTLCGTPEYLSPELVEGTGHGKGADYWALGVLIFEMLCGYSPFSDDTENTQVDIYRRILKGRYNWSSRIQDPVVKDLVRGLLRRAVPQRLGCRNGGIEEIKQHEWFRGWNWEALLAKKMLPPIIPPVQSVLDTSNFEPVNVLHADVVPFVSDGSEWDKEF